MWTARVREAAVRRCRPSKLLPGQAAGLRRVVDLRVRRADDRRVRSSSWSPASCSPSRDRTWWHTSRVGLLRQQPAPVERGAVLLLHGDPPVGEVLHGRLARAIGDDVGDRRGGVPRLHRHGVHRLPRRSRTSPRSGSRTEAKDGLNSVGVGAYFNVLNFGQMFMWHIVLLPLVVGVAHRDPRAAGPPARRRAAVPDAHGRDLDADRRRRRGTTRSVERRRAAHRPTTPTWHRPWTSRVRPGQGVRRRARRRHAADRALAVVFGSPDDQPVTIAGVGQRRRPTTSSPRRSPSWTAPASTATYGAAVHHTPDAAQKIGPICLQQHRRRHASRSTPRRTSSSRRCTGVPTTRRCRRARASARPRRRASSSAWAARTTTRWPRRPTATAASGRRRRLRAGARHDAGLLGAGQQRRPGRRAARAEAASTRPTTPSRCCSWPTAPTSRTRPRPQHLGGDQWGMMNETGSYPGQAWLWLYTFWYQIKPFSTSGNADALVWGAHDAAHPRARPGAVHPRPASSRAGSRVHRLIWRDYYRSRRTAAAAELTPAAPSPAPPPAMPSHGIAGQLQTVVTLTIRPPLHHQLGNFSTKSVMKGWHLTWSM